MESRRELSIIRKNLDRFHRDIGEVIMWAAYDPTTSTMDTVYNEPGERHYLTPVPVQTLWINKTEAGDRLDDERIDVRNNIRVAISLEALRNAGVPNVDADDVRIFDLFKYWGRVWKIEDWELLGRFPQQDSSTISLTAMEVDFVGDYPFETTLPIESA